jgi:hypothetical protein
MGEIIAALQVAPGSSASTTIGLIANSPFRLDKCTYLANFVA